MCELCTLPSRHAHYHNIPYSTHFIENLKSLLSLHDFVFVVCLFDLHVVPTGI